MPKRVKGTGLTECGPCIELKLARTQRGTVDQAHAENEGNCVPSERKHPVAKACQEHLSGLLMVSEDCLAADPGAC